MMFDVNFIVLGCIAPEHTNQNVVNFMQFLGKLSKVLC